MSRRPNSHSSNKAIGEPAVYIREDKETPNVERRTPNKQSLRVREEHAHGYNADRKTLNVQRSTSNAQWQKRSRFDLGERLLEFSARIIEIVDALPNTRAANHLAGQLLRC